jgi:hypothetical protein
VLQDSLILSVDNIPESWVTDSGTSFHATPHRKHFLDYVQGDFKQVHLGDDAPIRNITCLWHRDIPVCRLHEKRPSTTHRRNPFRTQVKRASTPISTFRMYPKNQISGGREITTSKAAPRLAQWIAPIACSGMDDSRSSQRARGTGSGHVGFSVVASAKGEGFMSLNIVKPRTPTAPKAPKLGPATSQSIFSCPSKGNTWQQIEPPWHFTHRDSKTQRAAPLYSDAQGAWRVPDPGPRYRRES